MKKGFRERRRERRYKRMTRRCFVGHRFRSFVLSYILVAFLIFSKFALAFFLKSPEWLASLAGEEQSYVRRTDDKDDTYVSIENDPSRKQQQKTAKKQSVGANANECVSIGVHQIRENGTAIVLDSG